MACCCCHLICCTMIGMNAWNRQIFLVQLHWHLAVWLYCILEGGRGFLSGRAPDSWSKSRRFQLPGQTFRADLFRYPFLPRDTAVARERSRPFCQTWRWQVTAKHTRTPRMWFWITCAETAAVLLISSHVTTKQRCKHTPLWCLCREWEWANYIRAVSLHQRYAEGVESFAKKSVTVRIRRVPAGEVCCGEITLKN